MDVNHPIIAKAFEIEINNQAKGIVEKQLAKKRPSVSNNAILLSFGVKDPFEKDDVQQKKILQNLKLLIVKIIFPFNLWKVFNSNTTKILGFSNNSN